MNNHYTQDEVIELLMKASREWEMHALIENDRRTCVGSLYLMKHNVRFATLISINVTHYRHFLWAAWQSTAPASYPSLYPPE